MGVGVGAPLTKQQAGSRAIRTGGVRWDSTRAVTHPVHLPAIELNLKLNDKEGLTQCVQVGQAPRTQSWGRGLI